jgi:hypothetical protein
MIHKRASVMATNKHVIWEAAEQTFGSQLNFAVDSQTGTKEEQHAWYIDQGITQAQYYERSSGMTFFVEESVAMLFYLRWTRP